MGVGRSPLRTPTVTPRAVRDALERAMEMSGLPTGPPAGVGVAPNGTSSRSSSDPNVTAIRATAQDLPSPTWTHQQLDVMERIARGDFLAGQIDPLLESVGLENNDLIDYITNRPPTPRSPSPVPPPPPPPPPRGMPRRPPRAVTEDVVGPRLAGIKARPAVVMAAAVEEEDAVVVGVGVSHPLDEDVWIKTDCDVRWIYWPKMRVNGPWGAELRASRIPIPLPRSTRMEENPKCIARPRVYPRPTHPI